MKTRQVLLAILVIAISFFANVSCKKSGPGSNEVFIDPMSYDPASITVKKGTTVTWTNKDSYQHSVTSDDGTSFSSGTIDGGKPYTFTPATTGTFPYHCTFHTMYGTLIVTN